MTVKNRKKNYKAYGKRAVFDREDGPFAWLAEEGSFFTTF